MPAQLYEILALAMRYWFVFLGVLIVLRAFLWQWYEQRARRRRLKKLPDAGMIGELLVISGSPELPEGTALPLPYEGVLGFVRACDVAVPCNRIAARHLDFSFQPGLGVLIYPRYRCTCRVDGYRLSEHSKPRLHPLLQGSILQVGEAELQVNLFDGLAAGLPKRRIKQQPAESMPAEDEQRGQPAQWPEAQDQPPTLFGEPLEQPAPPERRRRRGPSKKEG